MCKQKPKPKPIRQETIPAKFPSRRYRDRKGRLLFVCDGISQGTSWSTYWRKANGSLKRSRYAELAPRATQEEAQADLDKWATEQGFQREELEENAST